MDMPKIIEDQKMDGAQPNIIEEKIKKDKWAERLWPCMAWSVFLFNLALAGHFVVELYTHAGDSYDYAKHITTVTTMCASYIALIWTHKNILRNEDGRFE